MEEEVTSPVENVLNGYYKNAEVGASAIASLLDAVTDRNFRKELFYQRDYYEHQIQNLTSQMAEHYQVPVRQGTMAKFWTDVTIRMKKLKGLDVRQAAKLMVEGTNMGMIQLHQVLNQNPEIPDEIRQQGKKILSHEREYLDRITPYL
ncbi:MAG: hypothetical protein IJJ69_05395 [Oscillospiraceae bacterium]|nr:hypothetical protein [Oscillospiraceae bacterium]